MLALQRLAIAALPAMLLGCAGGQPQWLEQGPEAYCLSGIDSSCLSKLATEQMQVAEASTERDETLLRLVAISKAGVLDLPADLLSTPSSMDKSLYNTRKPAYEAAGVAIASMTHGEAMKAVESAQAISDKDPRVFALLNIVSLSDGTADEKAMGIALNSLYELDHDAYVRGLQGRLIGLLNKGDVERAMALGKQILKLSSGQRDGSIRPFASIAAAYAVAGLKGDATALVSQSVQEIPSPEVDDNIRFASIAMKAAEGQYPPPQDFHELTSDQIRLDAYLQLATLFRRAGNMALAQRALSDAVRFIQKSAFTLPRYQAVEQLAVAAFGQL